MRFTLLCSLLIAGLVFSASLRATEQRALENSEVTVSLLELTSDACSCNECECSVLKTTEASTALLQTDCKTVSGTAEGEGCL